MTIFISYARKDAPAVGTLRADLERAKRDSWHDAELTGGQVWWDTILAAIRTSDVFLIALSPDWLRSRACKSEYLYALACGRRVLAVKVAEVRPELAPQEIANSQIIDYRERTADSAIALVTALATLPPATALPSPLPIPPPVPMSYLSTYREQIEAPSLSFEEQHQLLFVLQGELADVDDEHYDTIVGLLQQFRRRRDIVESIGRDIDTMLAGSTARVAETRGGGQAAGPAPGWFPDPRGRFEQRYWDGTKWTAHVARAGKALVDPDGIGAGPARRSGQTFAAPEAANAARGGTANGAGTAGSGANAGNVGNAGSASTAGAGAVGNAGIVGPPAGPVQPFSSGAFAGLIVASVFCFGIVGLIVGFMNMKYPARKSQATALVVIGAVVIGLSIIYGLAAAAADSGSDF
jgi:TIR domain-containing protein/uncharacterized protein DUF2510